MVLYERSGEDIDRGLVGYWKLDDLKLSGVTKAIDRTNFNDGTITGATNTEGINGLNADAMSFDGVDDYVNTVNINDIYSENNALTISFWAKINNDLALSTILMSAQDGGASRLYFRTISNSIQWAISDRFLDCIPDDASKWNHYTITVIPSISKIYLNGIITDSNSGNLESTFGNEILKIGSSVDLSTFLNGSIRNVRIYNRALTSGEASKIARLRK